MKRRWRLWLSLAATLLAATLFMSWVLFWPEKRLDFSDVVNDFPLSKVEKDDRPSFRIDPSSPYFIEFGRGSGMFGLETVRIDQDGAVVLHRPGRRGGWFKGTLHLSEETLGQVLQAVKDDRLLGLHKAYHANVADGTQWLLWIKQGNNEKAVYFNNYFPPEIVNFAGTLDKLLWESGSESVTWLPVAGDHAKELWTSIKR